MTPRIAMRLSLLLCLFACASGAAPPQVDDVKAAITKLGGDIRPWRGTTGSWEVAFHLRGRALTDNGLAPLAGLGNVISLNLKGTRITSAGLAHIARLKTLRFLHLEQTLVDDQGASHLTMLPQLEYLNLFGTKITDQTLDRLSALKKLRRLYVWRTGVSDAGVNRLRKALPRLKVVRGLDLSKLPSRFPDETKKAAPKARLKWFAISSRASAPAKSANGLNTQVLFQNKSGRAVKLFWITYGGELKLYARLAPGAMRQQNSYARNVWLITDESNRPLGYFVVQAEESLAVIPPSSSSR